MGIIGTLVMLHLPSQEYGVAPFIQVFCSVSWQHFKVFFIQMFIFLSQWLVTTKVYFSVMLRAACWGQQLPRFCFVCPIIQELGSRSSPCLGHAVLMTKYREQERAVGNM